MKNDRFADDQVARFTGTPHRASRGGSLRDGLSSAVHSLHTRQFSARRPWPDIEPRTTLDAPR